MVRRPCKHSEKNSLRILKTIIHPVFEKPEYSLDTVYVTNHGGNPRNNKNKSGNSCALRLSVPNSVATGTTAWSLAVLRNRRAPFVCRIIPCFWCTGSQPLPLSAAQTQRRAQPPSPVQLGNSPQLLELSSPIRLWKQAQCRWMGHTDCDDSTLFFFSLQSSNWQHLWFFLPCSILALDFWGWQISRSCKHQGFSHIRAACPMWGWGGTHLERKTEPCLTHGWILQHRHTTHPITIYSTTCFPLQDIVWRLICHLSPSFSDGSGKGHTKCLAQYSVVPKSISHPSKAISAVIKMMEEKRNPSAILADSLSDIMNLEPRYFLVLQMNIKELHSNRINAKPALAQRSFAKLLFTHFRNMIPINEAANT